MKKIALILFLIPCFLLPLAQSVQASHAVGANITYAYVSPNHYMVTVKFYRDCGGAAAALPTTDVQVDYMSSSCGFIGFVMLPAVAGTGHEINTGLYPPCYVTSCQGGTGYGVQEWIYSGMLILPSACTDWVISATINARNALITTINNTGGLLSMYVETTLDNSNYPVNDSPVFSTYPVSTFCINHPFTYNQGAVDPNGDSLVFSLVDALSGSGIVCPYYIPYSGTNPFSSSTGVTINSQTGVISFTPNVIQVGVMAVLVQEYRSGVLIGSVRRDMQVNIEATCNFPPILQPTTFNAITANCGDSILYLSLVVPVKCNSVAPDGSDFRMLSPSGAPIPIVAETPINCIANMTDSIKIKLYAPALSENGTYFIWSKVGNDGNTLLNNCNNPMAEYDTASFTFNNCYAGIIDLTNVSVDPVNTTMEIYWTAPSNLPTAQFHSFDISRSDYPGGPYSTGVASVTSVSTGFYRDSTVNVPLKPYNYAIKIHLNSGYVSPFSDSIQSIFLSGVMNGDSTSIALDWTPYWGWLNPVYQVMESDDYGITFSPVAGASVSNASFTYTKPKTAGTYLLRIETSNGGSPNLVSRSNWYRFDVFTSAVIAPNVITPNGDGKNESFSFENLNLYPNSKLTVFNRWGRKIYENGNYQNDWKGDNLAEGVYYYTLKITDKKLTEISGTVNIIRNK